jgi:hypothetical protein
MATHRVYVVYIKLRAKWRSNKYQFNSLGCDLTWEITHDLTHSIVAREPLHHQWRFCLAYVHSIYVVFMVA